MCEFTVKMLTAQHLNSSVPGPQRQEPGAVSSALWWRQGAATSSFIVSSRKETTNSLLPISPGRLRPGLSCSDPSRLLLPTPTPQETDLERTMRWSQLLFRSCLDTPQRPSQQQGGLWGRLGGHLKPVTELRPATSSLYPCIKWGC